MQQRHNDNNVVPFAAPDEDKRVYECGACKAQGHRLLKAGNIFCGNCEAPSAFIWYRPQKKALDHKKILPRLMKSRGDSVENYVCRRCRFNRFHLHPSGTITCYRCRHSASFKWTEPELGGDAA